MDLSHSTFVAATFLMTIEARFSALNNHKALQELRNSYPIAQEYLLITNCVIIARLIT